MDEDLQTLVAILLRCYPGMPPQSASALASSEVLSETLAVAHSLRLALDSGHANSDFVIIVLYQLLEQTRERLVATIRSNPAFLWAVQSSGASWQEYQLQGD
jgi:hypothetical protein